VEESTWTIATAMAEEVRSANVFDRLSDFAAVRVKARMQLQPQAYTFLVLTGTNTIVCERIRVRRRCQPSKHPS